MKPTAYELNDGKTRYRLVELAGRHHVTETPTGPLLAWVKLVVVHYLTTEDGFFLTTEDGRHPVL